MTKIEYQVNLTHSNFEQIYFEIPLVLKNATTPLVMNINQLTDWTNKSLETLKLQVHQCTNAIHDLELRFNNSQYENNQQNITGSKFHIHHRNLNMQYVLCVSSDALVCYFLHQRPVPF